MRCGTNLPKLEFVKIWVWVIGEERTLTDRTIQHIGLEIVPPDVCLQAPSLNQLRPCKDLHQGVEASLIGMMTI